MGNFPYLDTHICKYCCHNNLFCNFICVNIVFISLSIIKKEDTSKCTVKK